MVVVGEVDVVKRGLGSVKPNAPEVDEVTLARRLEDIGDTTADGVVGGKVGKNSTHRSHDN